MAGGIGNPTPRPTAVSDKEAAGGAGQEGHRGEDGAAVIVKFVNRVNLAVQQFPDPTRSLPETLQLGAHADLEQLQAIAFVEKEPPAAERIAKGRESRQDVVDAGAGQTRQRCPVTGLVGRQQVAPEFDLGDQQFEQQTDMADVPGRRVVAMAGQFRQNAAVMRQDFLPDAGAGLVQAVVSMPIRGSSHRVVFSLTLRRTVPSSLKLVRIRLPAVSCRS